jgi:peptidoglycan hydrolase-like protein with peptidoglycan-binding domain
MNKNIVIAAAIFALSVPAFAQDNSTASTVIAAQPAGEEAASPLNLIAQAQTKLKQLGLYAGDVTGFRTNQTTRAIRAFQRAHNLHVNGDLNDETRTALGL